MSGITYNWVDLDAMLCVHKKKERVRTMDYQLGYIEKLRSHYSEDLEKHKLAIAETYENLLSHRDSNDGERGPEDSGLIVLGYRALRDAFRFIESAMQADVLDSYEVGEIEWSTVSRCYRELITAIDPNTLNVDLMTWKGVLDILKVLGETRGRKAIRKQFRVACTKTDLLMKKEIDKNIKKAYSSEVVWADDSLKIK